jgi:hypothetical protein
MAVAIATASFTTSLAAPAAAAPNSSPAKYCKSVYQPFTNPMTGLTFNQYVIPVAFSFGGETVVEDFGLSSFQASSALSRPA